MTQLPGWRWFCGSAALLLRRPIVRTALRPGSGQDDLLSAAVTGGYPPVEVEP
jgi:hypothetical protein